MYNIVILKLAAIGDVAAACQALLILNETNELTLVRFHWIIDRNLIALAQSLLNSSGIQIDFYGVDSQMIFKGSVFQKIRATLKLMTLVRSLKPKTIALLHRDSRYKTALQMASPAQVTSMPSSQILECALYLETLKTSLQNLNLPQKLESQNRSTNTPIGDTIGILVGGAQNQKIFYEEKRWPHFAALVSLILQKTKSSIVLFGSQQDQQAAQVILSKMKELQLDHHRIQDLTGAFNLAEIPEALKKLKTFISIDSGLAHVAATVMSSPHQKVLTLFGPTDHKLWKPMSRGQAQTIAMTLNTTCSPCYKNDGHFSPCVFKGDKFRHCLNDLSAETVFDAALSS